MVSSTHGSWFRAGGLLALVALLAFGAGCKRDSLEHYADAMDSLIDIHQDATADLKDADDGNEAARILRRYRKRLQKYLPEVQEFLVRQHDLKAENRLKVPEVVLEKSYLLSKAYANFKRTLLIRSPRFLLTLDYSKAYKEIRALATDSVVDQLESLR